MDKCPDCGEAFEALGTHWRWKPSHKPDLTKRQRETITGLLMGDGCVNSHDYLTISMVSKNYLEYLDDLFGSLTTGVKIHKTAKESVENVKERDFRPDAKEENYSDIYVLNSRQHDEIKKFREWYSTGEKVWPENIELTPTVLKHWYVCDGRYDNERKNGRIKISTAKEFGNKNKINRYFKRSNLPEPLSFVETEKSSVRNKYDIQWTIEDSYALWDYMGEPLPDFEYKWPEEYR